jgi:hypothetical protein
MWVHETANKWTVVRVSIHNSTIVCKLAATQFRLLLAVIIVSIGGANHQPVVPEHTIIHGAIMSV